jgi:hypothetical protein
MFTIEMDYDCTVITSLDDGGHYEDLEVALDETSVFIAQLIPGSDRRQVLEISIQQLKDILVAMDLPSGTYYQKDSLL